MDASALGVARARAPIAEDVATPLDQMTKERG
jgi:hypothetical protein